MGLPNWALQHPVTKKMVYERWTGGLGGCCSFHRYGFPTFSDTINFLWTMCCWFEMNMLSNNKNVHVAELPT